MANAPIFTGRILVDVVGGLLVQRAREAFGLVFSLLTAKRQPDEEALALRNRRLISMNQRVLNAKTM